MCKNKILRQKIILFPIAEGGAKIVGVFHVKNHDFTQKNHIFSNFKGGRALGALPLDPFLHSVNFQRKKAFVGLSDYRTVGLSDYRTVGL